MRKTMHFKASAATSGIGQKPSFPVRSKDLPVRLYERQASGDKLEHFFGSTRPQADLGVKRQDVVS